MFVKCKYYNLEEVQIMKIPNQKSSLSSFHINTCSLTKNFEDLQYLLKTNNINFDITAISETQLLKNINILKNINVSNFFMSLLQLNQQLGELYHTL